MTIYTTDKPRNTTGVMQYAKIDIVDCIDLRFGKSLVRKAGGQEMQIDATLVSGKLLSDGQYLYFEDLDPANVNLDKRSSIFVIQSISESAIGRHQYRLQFKEFHAS